MIDRLFTFANLWLKNDHFAFNILIIVKEQSNLNKDNY